MVLEAQTSIKEIWKAIPGYAGYAASTLGRIRSLDRIVVHSNGFRQTCKGKILTLGKGTKGYLGIHLGRKYQQSVHVLVALTFYGKPNNPKMEVNHKDGNKQNNEYTNLEWMTKGDNQKHKYRVLKCPPSRALLGRLGDLHHLSKAVIATDPSTGKVVRYGSKEEAKRAGYDTKSILLCCTKKQRQHKGLLWRWENDQ